MVRRGDFSLELVDAATKQPLKEYEHQGAGGPECWVAGDPGGEFLLQLTSHMPGKTWAYPIKVDDTNIGTGLRFRKAGSCVTGLLKQAQHYGAGSCTTVAFKFAVPASGDMGMAGCGTVSAVWSVAVDAATPAPGLQLTGTWGANKSAAAPDAKKAGVGALKAEAGQTQTSTAWSNVTCRAGAELGRITIHYCAAAGLAVRGLLPKAAASSATASTSAGGKSSAASGAMSGGKKRATGGGTVGGGGGKKPKTEAASATCVSDDEQAEVAAAVPSLNWPASRVMQWLRLRALSTEALAAFKGLDGGGILGLQQNAWWVGDGW